MSRHLTALLCSVLLMATACGDDDTPLPIDGAVFDGPAGDAATSGTLTIEANDVTGATGLIVLAFVTPSGGGPALGAICESVTTDPASVSAVAKMTSMGNPCDLGAEVIFDNGGYDVSAGIYMPGDMMPSRCADATVTVMGDTTVTLPSFALCN